MSKYQHLFFDLDRTLWDFERNSKETVFDLFSQLQLENKMDCSAEDFLNIYQEKNAALWALYRDQKIDKQTLREERFFQAMQYFGLENKKLALEFNDAYVQTCSSKPHLLPYAHDVLNYLNDNYSLHIITNGFVEAQEVKMKNAGLENYFDVVIVSDGLGFRKPDKRIFHHALKSAQAKQKESLMIGDDYLADIVGAKKVGIDQAYLADSHNNQEKATYKIVNLLDLKQIL